MWTENLGRAHRVAAAIEAGMCFVNSQNVRDLRQPFGGTKASGTGREGGTWSYEVFLEPKNVCVSLGSHPHPALGSLTMSLYQMQKFLFDINRDPVMQTEIPGRSRRGGSTATSSRPRSAGRSSRATSASSTCSGANGQLLMHFAALSACPGAPTSPRCATASRRHGPVRAGIYAMTTSLDEKVAGV